MDLKTAVELLEQHNEWRRGDDTRPMINPELMGVAIDIIVKHVKGYVIEEEIKQKISVIVSDTTTSGNEKRDRLLELYGVKNRLDGK